jgi:16S rRNA (guanine966-N2)-methyltransferase
MSAIASELAGARVVDLFAGSGALGLEALSRGASEVTFVENAASALRVLEKNIAALGPAPGAAKVVRAEALAFAAGLTPFRFDLALADPPYEQGHVQRLVEIHARTRFARLLCIEHSRDEPAEGGQLLRQRRYGDTLLTFLRVEDEP